MLPNAQSDLSNLGMPQNKGLLRPPYTPKSPKIVGALIFQTP